MDISGFLLTSGFVLLVVLLGWSNIITSKSKETKDLEAEFLKKANLKSADYKSIIDKAGSTKESLNMLVEFLYSRTREQVHIEVFERIKQVKKEIKYLDKEYSWRFWLLLITTGILFITGVKSLFLETGNKNIALLPNAFTVILLFKNLITVHLLENKYSENMYQIMEKL